jgi:hypothetical protein
MKRGGKHQFKKLKLKKVSGKVGRVQHGRAQKRGVKGRELREYSFRKIGTWLMDIMKGEEGKRGL